MKFLLGFVKTILYLLSTYSLSFAIKTLWNWFVVPLGAVSIGLAHAYGLLLFVGLFTLTGFFMILIRTESLPTDEQKKIISWVTPFVIIVTSLMTVGFGWVATLLM